MYLVIFHLKRKLPLGEFFRMINNKPMACNLLEVYCKEQDTELLKDFYYQDDRRIDSANVVLSEGFSELVRKGAPKQTHNDVYFFFIFFFLK